MRTVLVTGTSSGIGRATAVHLASRGMRVLAGVRREEDGASIRACSPELITPVVLDVTDPAAPGRVRELAEEHGLYGLVNNAGVTVQGPIEFLEPDDMRRQLEINVVAPVALTAAVLPALRASKGRIVIVGSIGGRMALPFVAPYHASKFALEGVADSLRMEVKPFGIEVALVEPGSVKTEIWRKGEEAGRRQLAELPNEGRQLYGKRLEGLIKMARKTGERGVEPIAVAEAIHEALTARRPRTRYIVGSDARVQALLANVLPDRALDALTARLTGTR